MQEQDKKTHISKGAIKQFNLFEKMISKVASAGGTSKSVNGFIKKIEKFLKQNKDYTTRDQLAEQTWLGATGLRFFLSLYDATKKALKIEQTTEKLKNHPDIKIKNLDGRVSLAYKIYQFMLSALQTLVLGALVTVGLGIVMTPAGSSATLLIGIAKYLTLASLGLTAAINFTSLGKSTLKLLSLNEEEKNLEAFFQKQDVDFKELAESLGNKTSPIQGFECELSTHTKLQESDLKAFFNKRIDYLELKDTLTQAGIDPAKVALLKENEPLPIDLQKKLKKAKGKVEETDLRHFSKIAFDYQTLKAALQDKIGQDFNLKSLIDCVDARKKHLKIKSIDKGLMVGLAVIAFLVAVFSPVIPLLTLVAMPIIGALWGLKLLPMPWKKMDKTEENEPQPELPIKMTTEEILDFLKPESHVSHVMDESHHSETSTSLVQSEQEAQGDSLNNQESVKPLSMTQYQGKFWEEHPDLKPESREEPVFLEDGREVIKTIIC